MQTQIANSDPSHGASSTRLPAERIGLLWQRGLLLEKLGRNQEAIANWQVLLSFEHSHLGALNRLGDLLYAAGEDAEAERVFAEAVASHPCDALSRVQLAKVLIKEKSLHEARKQLQQSLAIDPSYRPAHAGLAFLLSGMGEPEMAAWHGQMAFHGRCLVPATYLGAGTPMRVLELISTRGGNVRFESFLSNRVFQRYLVAAEFYDPTTPLPPHHLVVNAIGDADLAGDALAGAAALLANTSAPVINSPAAVLATGREAIAARLCAVPGAVTARTATLSRKALKVPNALAESGFEFPMLIRTPGFHGGEHFHRLDSAEDLPAALNELPGEELLVIQYLDSTSLDGKCRKYRVMMIDGQLHPLHCAVSRQWKIHFFSAEMEDSAEHRAEDAAFLANMATVIGLRAMAALRGIQIALGLDYGGIDFGLNPQGDLLLFEANATMVILEPDPDPRWDYRRPAVERACRAVDAMLMKRARHCSIAQTQG